MNNFQRVFLFFSTGNPGGDPGGLQGGLSPLRIESKEWEFSRGGGGGTPDITPNINFSGKHNRKILLVLI